MLAGSSGLQLQTMHMHANTFILGYWHQFSSYFEKNCQKTGEYDNTITLTCKLVFAAETVDGRGHRLLPWLGLWQKVHRRSGGQSQPGNVQVCVSMGGSSLWNILAKCSTILWVLLYSSDGSWNVLKKGCWGVCCSTKVRRSWTVRSDLLTNLSYSKIVQICSIAPPRPWGKWGLSTSFWPPEQGCICTKFCTRQVC